MTIKLSGKFSTAKQITGTYQLTTTDADCTAAHQTKKTFTLVYKHKTR